MEKIFLEKSKSKPGRFRLNINITDEQRISVLISNADLVRFYKKLKDYADEFQQIESTRPGIETYLTQEETDQLLFLLSKVSDPRFARRLVDIAST